jgi:hypothetical protein
MMLDRIDEVEPLVLEIICSSRREHQERRAVVAIGDDRHVAAEIWAVPGVKDACHEKMVCEQHYKNIVIKHLFPEDQVK